MIMLLHSLPIDRCVNGKPYDVMSLEKGSDQLIVTL